MIKNQSDKNYNSDICIIGYGLAATYLSNLLLPLQKKIIIIEKGNLFPSIINKRRNINYGIKHGASQSHLGIKLGGNSSRWGGQLVELTNEDLQKNYWGITFKELKNLYGKVYKNLEIKKSFKEKKIESNLYQYKSIFLKNPDLYELYRHNQNKIKFLTNTTALNFNFNNKTIKKLICVNKNDEKIFINSKVFIICNGAIESNRIMLTNKIINKKIPFKNNDNIGKYFADHIGFFAAKLKINNEKEFRRNFENIHHKKISMQNKFRYYDKKNKLNTSIELKCFSKHQIEIDQAKSILKKVINEKKIFSIIPIFFKFRLLVVTIILLFYYVKYKKIKIFYDQGVFLYFQSEHIKSNKNKINLLKSKLRDGLYKTAINWNVGENERMLFIKLCRKINLFLIKKNIGSLTISKNLFKKELFLRNIKDTNHASGGLQISKNPKNGVCDNNLKIHNTKNLFILSSSIFPSNGSANITLTIFAFAHKLEKVLSKFFLKK